ncbi:MAG: polysaccharide biosynthesis C-terminal domain-containing protein [Gammaproteobacteria bacterium]
MIKFSAQLGSIFFRGITVVSKFILLCFLAKWVTPSDLGLYGILTATIIIALQVVGFDFYAFNTREILKVGSEEQILYIKSQLVVHLISYLFFFPLFLFIFFLKILPWWLLVWFYVLLITEHLSQEADRLLVTLSKPLAANVVMFFRAGIWVYFLLFAYYVLHCHITLTWVWGAWFCGDIIALVLVVYLLSYLPWRLGWKKQLTWRWVRRGIKISTIFLIGTVCLQLLTYLSRYFIKFMLGLHATGIFVFYSNLLGVILTFAQIAIYNFMIPPIIQTFYQDNSSIIGEMRKLYVTIVLYLLLASPAAALGIYVVLYFVHKPVYLHYLWLFYILLMATIVTVLGQVPHYGLYIVYKEKWLLYIGLVSLFLGCLLNYIGIKLFGLSGAGWALVLTMLFMWWIKHFLFKRITRTYLS